MALRRRTSNVFFPWEKRRGVAGVWGRARGKLVLTSVLALSAFFWIRAREERAAGVRATRATLSTTYAALYVARADRPGFCPKNLAELVSGGYLSETPMDAWGRPLRIACPGRRDPHGFELTSDGPDGVPYGLDRVE
jgi:general secretion pathway protein G